MPRARLRPPIRLLAAPLGWQRAFPLALQLCAIRAVVVVVVVVAVGSVAIAVAARD